MMTTKHTKTTPHSPFMSGGQRYKWRFTDPYIKPNIIHRLQRDYDHFWHDVDGYDAGMNLSQLLTISEPALDAKETALGMGKTFQSIFGVPEKLNRYARSFRNEHTQWLFYHGVKPSQARFLLHSQATWGNPSLRQVQRIVRLPWLVSYDTVRIRQNMLDTVLEAMMFEGELLKKGSRKWAKHLSNMANVVSFGLKV